MEKNCCAKCKPCPGWTADCECHATKAHTDPTGWAEEFDKFGMHQTDGLPVVGWPEMKSEIKAFITELLTTQKREIRDRIVGDLMEVAESEEEVRVLTSVLALLDESSSL